MPTASVTQAATSQDIFFVPYDEAAMESLTQGYQVFGRITVPAGTYRGLDEDFSTLMVGALHVIASAEADEDLVYTVAKTLYEARQSVIERHGVGRFITEENAPLDTGTPYHPGAIRFYREAGLWPEDGASE